VTKQGLIIVLSAPSGTGKSAVLGKALELVPNLSMTVSATTRPARAGETDGEDYHFLSREEFERHIEKDDFVEFAMVHGNLYGTLRSELDKLIKSGNDVVLELDVQGMRNIKRYTQEMVSIFLMPPSIEELANRLRKRATESEAALNLRLRNAEAEIAARGEFDYVVVNEKVSDAAADLRAILRAEHCRAHRQL